VFEVRIETAEYVSAVPIFACYT